MTPQDFQYFYSHPTNLIKQALHIVEQLFCHPSCLPQCSNPCTHHHPARTLLPQHMTINHHILPPTPNPPLHPPPLPLPPLSLPPRCFTHNLTQYPITTILDHKNHKIQDYKFILKTYTLYLCQWQLPNHVFYNKWLSQEKLLPWHNPVILSHSLTILTQYYKTKKHQFFSNILKVYFSPLQIKDTRYIPPPLNLPLINISIHECNPKKDILTNIPLIQVQHNLAHIYNDTGTYLATIPLTRLKWLWAQYHRILPHPPPLEPPIQSFETKLSWLIQ
jgi:hypothetical protein